MIQVPRTTPIKRDFLFLNCWGGGHAWESIGGCNCGCEDGRCSVPVLCCTRCGDCDYGDNEEAKDIRRNCESIGGGDRP